MTRTPWASGLTVAGMCGALVAVAVYTFSRAVAEIHPALAVVLNAVAVGGAAPTVWRWRRLAVRRWVACGIAVGVILGWLALVPTMLCH